MRLIVLVLLGILLMPLKIGIERKVLKSKLRLNLWSAILKCRRETIANWLAGLSYLFLWSVLDSVYIAFSTPVPDRFVYIAMAVVFPGTILAILATVIIVYSIRTQRLIYWIGFFIDFDIMIQYFYQRTNKYLLKNNRIDFRK